MGERLFRWTHCVGLKEVELVEGFAIVGGDGWLRWW